MRIQRDWFNSKLLKKFNRELEYRYGINKSTYNFSPIENTSQSEDSNRKGRAKNIHSWRERDNYSYSNVDHLFGVKDIRNFISDDTFLVRDSNGDSYSIYFEIENHIFEIDNDHSFLSELESFFSSYRNSSYINNGSTSEDSLDNHSMYDNQSSWNNHITSCINSYLQSQICIDPSIRDDSNDIGGNSNVIADDSRDIVINGNESSYFSRWIFEKDNGSNDNGEGSNDNGEESNDIGSNDNNNGSIYKGSNNNGSIYNRSNDNGEGSNANPEPEGSNHNDPDSTQDYSKKYRHLWVQCEYCYALNYKRIFKSKMNICEQCGYHLKMSSSERIEGLIDPGTWDPMDEDMVSIDPIQWDLEDPIEWEDESDKASREIEAIIKSIIKSIESHGQKDLSKKSFTRDPSEADIEDPSDSDFDSDSDSEDYDFDSQDQPYKDKDKDGIDSDSENQPDGIDSDSEDQPDGIDSDWDSEEEDKTYKDRIDSYQIETGLTEAVQTGVGQLNGIPVAIGVMDFQFMGGSMGSVVGEKITRLIEYATNQFLPLIIVCASGGARMQEGSLSLMQMAKISSALYDYQSNKKLFYVSILTSPTTGGVTASFGMLGDIIIAEPNSYIAFAGKRVIEETLKQTVPEGSQETEYLFDKGLFDLIVPRTLLKDVLSELLKLHGFFPLNYTSIK